jgi:hypothetical protein
VKAIVAKHPEGKFETLRDCTWEQLEEVRQEVGEEDYKRAHFVLGEKDRVLAVCDALVAGDYETVGKKMYETHEGLSKEYEVSCEELDFLNDIAKECGVTGSRIMGGGFGGCTINLVKNELYRPFIETAKNKYADKYGKERKCPLLHLSDRDMDVSLEEDIPDYAVIAFATGSSNDQFFIEDFVNGICVEYKDDDNSVKTIFPYYDQINDQQSDFSSRRSNIIADNGREKNMALRKIADEPSDGIKLYVRFLDQNGKILRRGLRGEQLQQFVAEQLK